MIACGNDIEVTVDLYGFRCHPQILGLGLVVTSVLEKIHNLLSLMEMNLHFAFSMEEETLLIGSNTLELGD